MTGTLYNVSTKVDTADAVAENVTSGSTPSEAAAQSDTKADYQSTKTVFTPAVDTNDTVSHVIAVTNNLQNISPTGLMFRYGPYVLTLLGGILLLFLGVKFLRRSKKENETA